MESQTNSNVVLSTSITSRITKSNDTVDEQYFKYEFNISITITNTELYPYTTNLIGESGTSSTEQTFTAMGWDISRDSLETLLFSQGTKNLIWILVLIISSLALVASIKMRCCRCLKSERSPSV